MEGESWKRNHGGGIMEEESWRRNHGGVEEEPGKKIHEGCIWQPYGRHPELSWDIRGSIWSMSCLEAS